MTTSADVCCTTCDGPMEPGFRYCLVCGSPVAPSPSDGVGSPSARAAETRRTAETMTITAPPTFTGPQESREAASEFGRPGGLTVIRGAMRAPVPAATRTPVVEVTTADARPSPIDLLDDHPATRPPAPGATPPGRGLGRTWLALLAVFVLTGAGLLAWQQLRDRGPIAAGTALATARSALANDLAELSRAGTPAAVVAVAARAAGQADSLAESAASANPTDTSTSSRLRAGLREVAALRDSFGGNTPGWATQSERLRAALLAAPAGAGAPSTDEVLANLDTVMSDLVAAQASQDAQVTQLREESERAATSRESAVAAASAARTTKLTALDDYADGVRSDLADVAAARRNAGTAISTANFGGVTNYDGPRLAVQQAGSEVRSAAESLSAMTPDPAMSWQHDALARTIEALGASADRFVTALTAAENCRDTALTGGATLAAGAPGSSTAQCDASAREAGDAFAAALASDGPAVDAAISAWESRVSTVRSEIGG